MADNDTRTDGYGCAFGTDPDECSMTRERMTAGTDDPRPVCPVHEPGCCLGGLMIEDDGRAVFFHATDCPAHGWDDDDTAALADEMSRARATIGRQWTTLVRAARAERLALVFLQYRDRGHLDRRADLANRAAESGLVPMRGDDPARARERIAVAAFYLSTADPAAFGPSGARFYEDSDGFEERNAGGPVKVGPETVGATILRGAIYAAGAAGVAHRVTYLVHEGGDVPAYILCAHCIGATIDPAATARDIVSRADTYGHCVGCDYHDDDTTQGGRCRDCADIRSRARHA